MRPARTLQYRRHKPNQRGRREGAREVRAAMVLGARESRAQGDGPAVITPLEGKRWLDRQSPLS